MRRLLRVFYTFREQITWGLLTLAVLIVGYFTAIEATGEPFRSRVVLLLLIAFAFLAGWLHEMNRPGGTFDLLARLDERDQEDRS